MQVILFGPGVIKPARSSNSKYAKESHGMSAKKWVLGIVFLYCLLFRRLFVSAFIFNKCLFLTTLFNKKCQLIKPVLLMFSLLNQWSKPAKKCAEFNLHFRKL